MPLSAGRLRHRIMIQRPVQTQDPDTGGMTTAWVDVATSVPAAVEPLSVKELIAAQSTQSQVTARITIRHRDGLSADMRILHKGKIYNPAGFLPDKDSGLEYLTIPVTEGVTNGQ